VAWLTQAGILGGYAARDIRGMPWHRYHGSTAVAITDSARHATS